MYGLLGLPIVWTTLLTASVAHAAAPSPASPEPKTGRCVVRVDRSEAGSPRCQYDMAEDGSFELWPDPPSNYYVMVDGVRGNSAFGLTNGGEKLGALKRRGACWVNKRTRICLWRK